MLYGQQIHHLDAMINRNKHMLEYDWIVLNEDEREMMENMIHTLTIAKVNIEMYVNYQNENENLREVGRA